MTPKTVAQVAIGGAVAVIVGTFLPWLTVTAPLLGTISRNGIDTAVGVAIAWSRYKGGDTTKKRVGAVVVVLASAAVLYSDVMDIRSRIASLHGAATVATSYGAGLYLCGAGIVAALVSVVSDMPNRVVEVEVPAT